MRIQYNGIALTMNGGDVPFSATPLWAWDVIVTAAQVDTTLKGSDGNIMAHLAPGIPFQIPGAGHKEWGDEPQIDLSQYSASAAAGSVFLAYSERRA